MQSNKDEIKQRNDKLVEFLINYRKTGFLENLEEQNFIMQLYRPIRCQNRSLVFQKSSAQVIKNGIFFCKKCKVEIDNYTVYCGVCAQTIPTWRFKNAARSLTKKLITHGIIKKENCKICNDPNSQVHHTNYSKPLEIIWFCAKHHRKEHQRLNRLGIKL